MSSSRDNIIQATCTLIELQGYNGTGLNQIIQESGSPKGSLYYYFPGGKEELTAEAMRSVGDIVLKRIKDNLSLKSNCAEAISDFINNIAHNVEASGFQSGGPITTVALETASTSEMLRETCHEIYQKWVLAFSEKLIESGFTQQNAQDLGQFIIASIEGGIILSRTAQNADALRQVAVYVGTLVTHYEEK